MMSLTVLDDITIKSLWRKPQQHNPFVFWIKSVNIVFSVCVNYEFKQNKLFQKVSVIKKLALLPEFILL